MRTGAVTTVALGCSTVTGPLTRRSGLPSDPTTQRCDQARRVAVPWDERLRWFRALHALVA